MSPELWQMLGLYLLAVNVAALWVMGADKARSRKERWRISEKALFLPAVLGGGLGGVLGMILGPILLLVLLNLAGMGMFRGLRMDLIAAVRDIASILSQRTETPDKKS